MDTAPICDEVFLARHRRRGYNVCYLGRISRIISSGIMLRHHCLIKNGFDGEQTFDRIFHIFVTAFEIQYRDAFRATGRKGLANSLLQPCVDALRQIRQ